MRAKLRFGSIQGVLLLVTVLIGLFWCSRAKLPYDQVGRWFDEEQLLVYEYQTVEVLRVCFIVSFTALLISLVGATKHD